ncbi:MAG: hypothetical protein KatS3mg062_1377 [Tepidiforma sp.]|nr:MAG: hypothetical protein KatS3mg062_1377 [Tepidiforma sp.]
MPEAALRRYPGWIPKICRGCRDGGREESATPSEAGVGAAAAGTPGGQFDPQTGIFTDGACSGNPGPGGWGAVYVRDGRVVDERQGYEAATTNNRMEWMGMIAGLEMAPSDEPMTVYSDSQYVVRSLNEWAEGWEARGWKRKGGPVENLDLVQRAWELKRRKPKARIVWLRGHSTSRWNAYADRLATAHLRGER